VARQGRLSGLPQVGRVNWVFVAVGIVGALWILRDIFMAVLVPRAIDDEWRISVWFARFGWRFWRSVLTRMQPIERREELAGSVAPLMFVLLVGIWLCGLVLAYGLAFYGLRDQLQPVPHSFGAAIYYAGTGVLTIGYGDYVAVGAGARAVSLFAAASGLGTVAITIAFLFLVIGAFADRERFVVVFDSRAGAPPSGLALLETYAKLDMLSELPDLLRDSQSWIADVLNSHLAYPILMSFRSSHRDESWVAALGALLDAAALLVTVIEGEQSGEARLLLDVGMHLTHDLASYFVLPEVETGATQEQFAVVCARLKSAGFRVKDGENVWQEFYALRRTYARTLAGIGQRWLTATAQLVGERTALPGHAS